MTNSRLAALAWAAFSSGPAFVLTCMTFGYAGALEQGIDGPETLLWALAGGAFLAAAGAAMAWGEAVQHWVAEN